MKDRRIALFAAIGCIAYAATLIATLPAPWVAELVARLSKHALQLRDPQGSAWKGSGQLYLRQRSGDLLNLGSIRWNFSLPGILAGRLATDLSLGNPAGTLHLQVSPASTALRGVNLQLPGAILAVLSPATNALGPQGILQIRSENLRFDADEVLGGAEIEWRPVRLAAARGLGLGSHVARLRGAGRKIDIEFGTIDGPLRLSGGGAWSKDNGLTLSGLLEHGENQPEIATFLRNICSDYRDRRCTFGVRQ